MLSEIISWHRWAVEGLLLVMLFNLVVPYRLRQQAVRMIFWTRVGYFAFWALWSMTAFGGLIAWMFTQRQLPTPVIVMIVVAFVVAFIDGYRGIKLKHHWVAGNDGIGFNTRLVGIELVLGVAMFLYGLYG
jgi:hypothetical protein